MQRFFADPSCIDEAGREIRIGGTDVNHIQNVLRMRPGEELWVSDGERKEYHCSIREYTKDQVILEILYAQEPEYELPCDLYLFQCIPKGDKMDMIVQKAVELGAAGIVPVESARCIVKLDARKAEKRQARWQQIAEGAAKQSRRGIIPEVMDVMTMKQAVAYAGSNMDYVIFPYELAEGMDNSRKMIYEICDAVTKGISESGDDISKKKIGIFIGPEGGFAESEAEALQGIGAYTISLGHRILRTETAGLMVLSVLGFLMDRD